jgi:hypothetical protein
MSLAPPLVQLVAHQVLSKHLRGRRQLLAAWSIV